MRPGKAFMFSLLGMFAVFGSAPAFAHGHVGWGISFGFPLYAPAYGGPPAYYYPPVVAAPAVPTAYVEQSVPQAAPDQSSWWYYCTDSRAYYPYVKECSGGWQRVAPQPPR